MSFPRTSVLAAGNQGASWNSGATFDVDQEGYFTIATSNPTNGVGAMALALRHATAGDFNADHQELEFGNDSGVGFVDFYRVTGGGTYTQLGVRVTLGAALVIGDQCGGRIHNDTIEAYVNGQLVGTRIDSTIMAAGALSLTDFSSGGRFADVGGGALRTGTPFTVRQSTLRGGDVLRGAVAGATTFDAAVTVSIVSAGALTTQIVCAGSAAMSVVSAGALTTSIRCAGAVSVSIAASGSLTTAITCAASANVSLTTSGALTTQILCAASAALSITSTGSLTTSITCAAAVSCTLSTAGDLTTASGFNAAVTGSLIAAGALTTQIVCAGSAAVSIASAGSLTTAIQCAGSASGSIVASGSITTGIRLVAASSGTVNASGVLSTSIWMAATPAGTLSTTGVLSTQILLTSNVLCALVSSGDLSTGVAFGVPVLIYVRVTPGLARQLACAAMVQQATSISAVSRRTGRVTPLTIQPARVSQEIARLVTV